MKCLDKAKHQTFHAHAIAATRPEITFDVWWGLLLQMSPVKIDGAKRQLFSLVKSQNVKLQGTAQKKKKSSPPPADSLAAADTAAETAEAAAAEADGANAQAEEEQPAAVEEKKKRLQTKKEKSADGVIGDGTSIKRKRKEDSDIKVSNDVLQSCPVTSSYLCSFIPACN